MLQDRLEEFIDVSVGNTKKIDPSFLVEEKLDYLIIGDSSNNTIPSLEIQNWLLKYEEVSKKHGLIVKGLSCFYVSPDDVFVDPAWIELVQDIVGAEIVYPSILRLKSNVAGLVLEDRTLVEVKDYADDFIKFLIKNETI